MSLSAVEDLERLIRSQGLPGDTRDRLVRSLQPLQRFPLLGVALEGRWPDFRFVLGPWRWMVVVCAYLEAEDRVVVVTIPDGRSSTAPTVR